jgi:diguanylate cyclase (GGDEF)-like protein
MTVLAPSSRRVLLLHGDPAEASRLSEILSRAGFDVDVSDTVGAPTDLFEHPPSLLLVAEGVGGRSVETLARDLKADPLMGRLPIVFLIRDVRVGDINWEALAVDDYITVPYVAEEVVRRLRLSLSRLSKSLDANPLTGLPGNTSILYETTRRIESGRPFALAYLDIDNFKAFNDRYGYSRGDEVLVVTCRLISTAVSERARLEGFVGHIGGDDFVLITGPAAIDEICQTIIRRFDLVIADFYDEEDRARGYIDSVDRHGNREAFPIMTLSIVTVSNETCPITHPGDISERVSQLKKKVKAMRGSNYLRDRRGAEAMDSETYAPPQASG